MLKIRLKRVGRRNDPSFRIVVTESARGPKSGNVVEQVGFYNPKTKERSVDGARVSYWMERGAQPSDTLYNMLVDEKVIGGKKKNVLPRKSPVVKEQPTSGDPQRTTEVASEGQMTETAGAGGSKGEETKPAKPVPTSEEVSVEKVEVSPSEAPQEEVKETLESEE